jgi:VWFA-related protein
MQPRSDQSRSRSSTLRTDVKLVLIPVTVTDLLQHPVLDLKKHNFRVFDDGVEQKISQFFMEESPVSVGMVFDASNSMRKKIDESRQALTQFLRMSTPGDEFSLWKFSDRPQTVCPFTTNAAKIEDSLALIQSGGWTSLFDALYLALNQMKRATHGTKVLFVLSDGGDNNSRYTEREIKNMIREADVRIFSISILDHSPTLERISDESGGRAYRVHKLDELPEMAAKLSGEIHSHYMLGYLPEKAQNDGKYHKVGVKLFPPAGSPRLHVAWRRGYYAPLH